jgi:ankyrin repeat protein
MCDELEALPNFDFTLKLRRYSSGETALLAAVRAGQVAAMNQCLRRGADANYENAKGCTALILAIELGRFDAVLALVDRGRAVHTFSLSNPRNRLVLGA